MRTTAILALLLSLIFSGCDQKREQQPETEGTDHVQTTHAGNMTWETEMQLNKGSRWQANNETTEGIRNMGSLTESSSANSVEEYQNLGSNLIEEVNTLIKNCTMKGPLHDNLHTYLEPLIINLAQLQQVTSVEEGEQYVSKIKAHLQAYQRYFM